MKSKKEKYIHLTADNTYRVQIRPSQKIRSGFDEIYKTLEEAIENRDKFLAKQKLGIDTYVDRKITFEDFCDKYYDWYKNKPKKPSPHTLRDYKCRMRPLKEYFGKRPFYKITTEEIEEFIKLESQRYKIDPGHPEKKTYKRISSNTLHHEFVMLRILFNKGVTKWKLRSDNPMDGVEEPQFKIQDEIKHIPYEKFEETTELIEKYASFRDRAIFYLGLYCGLRAEEVCGIHCETVDDKKATIDLERGLVEVKYAIKWNPVTRQYEEYEILKSHASKRIVPLPDIVIKSIRDYLKVRQQYVKLQELKYGSKYKKIPNLFLGEAGNYFRPPYVGKLWKKFATKNNIDVTFHGLRHSYLTYQANYNPNLSDKDLMALAGHSNITTTQKYIHKSMEKVKKSAKVFNDIYNNKIDFNNDNSINAPIMFVASIINDINYVDINEVIKLVNAVDPKSVINFGNISNKINETRDYILNNYPALEELIVLGEKYDKEKFEDIVRNKYGDKLVIMPKNKDLEYDLC